MQPVLLTQLLVKVLHVEVEVLLPVQPQHLLQIRYRHALRTRPPLAVVPQAAVAVLLILLPPAPHRAVGHADDLGRFPPLQLAGHRLQNHFLNLHRPLHLRGWELLLDGFHIV